MFKHLNDAISWIEQQVKFKPKTDLDRMHQAFLMLDIDLSNIKKIHVAGTNGKGSVASFLSHIAIENKLKVGTYTSPYLVYFNERIRIQMNPIGDQPLLDLINQMYLFNQSYLKTYQETLSFFEMITLMCFKYFHDENVDLMIIEVGLGGLYDATNILNYDLSLITSIGFDHMKQLGNTLESISFNKLGILKPNNHLITSVSPMLHGYFKDYLKDKDVTATFLTLNDIEVVSLDPISFYDQDVLYTLSLSGPFQILNGLLAIRAFKYLYPNTDSKIIQLGLNQTTWQGRMEKLESGIFLDGAHNLHAIEALKETIVTLFKDRDVYILFSALSDKDIKGMLNILREVSKKIILTSFPDPRFLPYELDIKDMYIEDPISAISKVKEMMKSDDVCIITGSLHFAGFIKSYYLKKDQS